MPKAQPVSRARADLDQQDLRVTVVMMEHLAVLASLEPKATLAYLALRDRKEHRFAFFCVYLLCLFKTKT